MFDHNAFLLYAQGILPLLMPVAVLLTEPPGWRRIAITVLTLIGGIFAAWVIHAVMAVPSRTFIDHHSITCGGHIDIEHPTSSRPDTGAEAMAA